jgi:hypothetical protein
VRKIAESSLFGQTFEAALRHSSSAHTDEDRKLAAEFYTIALVGIRNGSATGTGRAQPFPSVTLKEYLRYRSDKKKRLF